MSASCSTSRAGSDAGRSYPPAATPPDPAQSRLCAPCKRGKANHPCATGPSWCRCPAHSEPAADVPANRAEPLAPTIDNYRGVVLWLGQLAPHTTRERTAAACAIARLTPNETTAVMEAS